MAERMPTHRPAYAWFVLFMMILLYLVNVIDRFLTSGLLEEIKKTFDVSDTFMGLLVGPAFAIVYTALAIPIARLADRRSRVKIIAAGAVIWSAFTVMSGLVTTPWMFAVARLGVGVGEAAFLAPAFSLLADYFPPKKRAFAFALLGFGAYFGQVFGLVGGAAIAEASHWRNAFIYLGAPGIILAVLALLFVREPVRGRLDPDSVSSTDSENSMSLIQTFRILWARRSFRLMTIGTALGGFSSYGFGIWAPTLFARAFDLSLTEANSRYGLPSFAAGLAGALILGLLCDRLASKNAAWPYRLAGGGLVGFFVSMFILCFVRDVNIATALCFPAGLMAGGWVIAMQSALQDLLPAKARATGSAIWGFALAFSGLALGVLFVGFVSDVLNTAFGDDAIRIAMAVTLLPVVPATIFLFLAGQTVQADRAVLISALE